MEKILIAMAVAGTSLVALGAYAEPLGRQTTQQAAQGPETVVKVQAALAKEGYYPGQIDGQFSRQTEDALKQAQADKSLAPTGQLDQQTLAALGVSESTSSAND